jgi:hypothetical protein
MSGFIIHDKIAGLAGIPDRISNEINRFIDDADPPREFEEHNSESKIFVCGHLNVSIRHLTGSEKSLGNPLQERGKMEWVQKEDLKWMLATRKEYIQCYYLHLAVDYIYDTSERIKKNGLTIGDCINRWEKEHSVMIPGTEPYLKDVLGFLRNNTENIKQILFPE